MTYEEDNGFDIFGQSLWMAATEREREEKEKLKNQNERMEFVRDPKNWKTTAEMPGIRMSALRYKSATWYKLEIWMTWDAFDYEKRQPTEKTGWQEIRMFKKHQDTRAFTRSMSPTEIANEIKEIDKKGEAKK